MGAISNEMNPNYVDTRIFQLFDARDHSEVKVPVFESEDREALKVYMTEHPGNYRQSWREVVMTPEQIEEKRLEQWDRFEKKYPKEYERIVAQRKEEGLDPDPRKV